MAAWPYVSEDPPEDPPEDGAPLPCELDHSGQMSFLSRAVVRPAPAPAAPCPPAIRARLAQLRFEAWIGSEIGRGLAPHVFI